MRLFSTDCPWATPTARNYSRILIANVVIIEIPLTSAATLVEPYEVLVCTVLNDRTVMCEFEDSPHTIVHEDAPNYLLRW